TRMKNVSDAGGLSDSRPKSHRNGHSGRGLAPGSVGSGGPVGPFGPRTAASTATAITARGENRASFRAASPVKGAPGFSSFSYFLAWVFGTDGRPAAGGGRAAGWRASQR